MPYLDDRCILGEVGQSISMDSEPSALPWPSRVGAAMLCAPTNSPTDTRQAAGPASPPTAIEASLWSTNSSEYLALAASASAASPARSLSCFGSRSGTPSQRPGWRPRSLDIRPGAMSLGAQQYLTASRGLPKASSGSPPSLAVSTRLPSPIRTGPIQKHSIAPRAPAWPLRVSAPFLACFSPPSRSASQVRPGPHVLPHPHSSSSPGVHAPVPTDGARHPYIVDGAEQSYLAQRTPAGGGMWVGADILDAGECDSGSKELCYTEGFAGGKQGSGLRRVRNAVYDSARPERNSLSSSSLGTWSPRDQLCDSPASHSRLQGVDLIWEDADGFELTCTGDSLSPFASVGLTCSMTDTEEPMSHGGSAGGNADAVPAQGETPAPLTQSDARHSSSMRSPYGGTVWSSDVGTLPQGEWPPQSGQEEGCMCPPGKEIGVIGLDSGDGSEIWLDTEDGVTGAKAEKAQDHVGRSEQGPEAESVRQGNGVEGGGRDACETLSDTGFWADDEESSDSNDGEDSVIRDAAGFVEIAGIPGLGEGMSPDEDVWAGKHTQHADHAILPVAFGSIDMLCDMVEATGGTSPVGPPQPAYRIDVTAHTPGGLDNYFAGPDKQGQRDAAPPPYCSNVTAHTRGGVDIDSPEPDAQGQGDAALPPYCSNLAAPAPGGVDVSPAGPDAGAQAPEDAPGSESAWRDDEEQPRSECFKKPEAEMLESRPRVSLPSPFSTGNLGWVSRCSGSGRVSRGDREDAEVVWDGEALVVPEGRFRAGSAPLPLALREGGCLRRASSEDSIASFAHWLG